jgi:uncharacterized protein (DUF58 family)
VETTRSATPKLGAYAGLAALGLLVALALRRPELAAAAAPFAVLAAVPLAAAQDPRLDVLLELERERALEGDELELTVRLAAAATLDRVELALVVPHGLVLAGQGPRALRLRRGEQRSLSFRVRCARWGAHRPASLAVRATPRFGLVRYEVRCECAPLRVYPRPETLRALLAPLETQVFAGNRVARQKGEGSEFADLRRFVPGDRIRRINWRTSARRNELWVNERHAERNADVVLLLDALGEADRPGTTLVPLVRAAAALAEHYLRQKDRVGLVSLGGTLSWLRPGSGTRQLYRVVESLLESGIVSSYAWSGVDLLPVGVLPPKALVLALSPLLDERAGRALLDLRARGFDLAVIDASQLDRIPPGRTEADRLAFRIWQLRRAAMRSRLQRAGVPVATWDEAKALATALEEVRSFRRHPVRARA